MPDAPSEDRSEAHGEDDDNHGDDPDPSFRPAGKVHRRDPVAAMRTLLGVFMDRPSARGAREEVVVRLLVLILDPFLLRVVVPGHVWIALVAGRGVGLNDLEQGLESRRVTSLAQLEQDALHVRDPNARLAHAV